MIMRLVRAKVKFEALFKLEKTYNEIIIPRLEKTAGCLYVGVIIKEPERDEGISMTFWDSLEHIENYEKSGKYRKNLEEVKPYLSDSSEWKIQLSEEMNLEYQPVFEEPEVKSYTPLAHTEKKMPSHEKIHLANIRLVSVKVHPGKLEEFKQIYIDEIIPALRIVKGCREAYLIESTENRIETISVTFWDSKQDADNYEKSGLFGELLQKIRHTFSELYQWKIAREKEKGAQVVTSEDLSVKLYTLLTGKNFKQGI